MGGGVMWEVGLWINALSVQADITVVGRKPTYMSGAPLRHHVLQGWSPQRVGNIGQE